MSTKVEALEKNMIKLTIEVDADRFEEGMKYAYNKNKKHLNIPGFRKGRVPRTIAEKYYGAEVFYEDAINYVIPDAYEKAIEENNLEVVSQPKIDVEQVEKGKNLIFTAEVAVKPEVVLGQYKDIEIEKIQVEVTDEEVQAELEKTQQQNARIITIEDRPVQDKDQLSIDFEGFVDGEPFEGGKGENYPLTIGSGTFIDTFEEQLIGKNIGEEVEVNVTFPEDYHEKALAGKPALFKVTVKEIKEQELPALDDEFAKDVSEFDTLDEYKKDLKATLLKQKEHQAEHEKEDKVMEKVIENAKMEIPDPMIETQVDQMVQDFSQRLQYQGLPLDTYLQFTGNNMMTLRENFKKDALRNIQSRLALEVIAKEENIEVSNEELEEEIKKMAEMYKMEVEKLKESISEREKEYMKEDMKVTKALAFVMEHAKEVE
ncbi:MAG: trigger factor [Epulopiscium sp.]|nr:trigger factor [Candidatus Epulonipiscium sp.]